MARPKNGNFNDATGDSLVTKAATDAYLSGWEAIWGSKKKEELTDLEEPSNVVLEDEASPQ